MNKSNTQKQDCRTNSASTGSNRSENPMNWIPGTTIPKRFYVTIVLDTKKLIKANLMEWRKIAEAEFMAVMNGAIEQIRDYRLRHRIFEFYGCDPGHGFEMEYSMFWATTDDGTTQLLRGDFLSIGMRAIDAEMDYLDGKLEEVNGVLKLVI